MVPRQGSYRATNSEGVLIALMAAKARTCALGNASANLFAAPKRVDPRVTMSSTNTISFDGGSEMRPWTAIVSNCSVGVGLSDGSLQAAFLSGLVRTRHAATSLPRFLSTRAIAILWGTQRVPGCIRVLFGTGTRAAFALKKEAKGNFALFC